MDPFSKSISEALDALPPAPDTAIMDGLMTGASAWSMTIPPREWLVDTWIPVGGVTLMTGRGGVGKTLLAQQIASCVAGGRPIFGLETKQTPVLALYGEDDNNELARRQQSIMRVEGLGPDDLHHYHFKSLFGDDTLLGSFDKNTGAFVPSSLYISIRDTAVALGARLIILDNATMMFPADPNERGPVVRFLQHLNRLALDIEGAVLLLGHVAKSEDSTYTGSTAWRDNIRAGLIITRPETPPSRSPEMLEIQRNNRCVKTMKANYGVEGLETLIRWDRGAFIAVDDAATDRPTLAAQGRAPTPDIDDVFLENLRALTRDNIAMSASKQAMNYAPKVMYEYARTNKSNMELALESLINAGRLEVDAQLPWKKENRHPARGIAEKVAKPLPALPAPAAYSANDILDKILKRASRGGE